MSNAHQPPRRKRHADASRAKPLVASQDDSRSKSDDSLVELDNPDDGEIFETGDNADFAGAWYNDSDVDHGIGREIDGDFVAHITSEYDPDEEPASFDPIAPHTRRKDDARGAHRSRKGTGNR